MTTARAFVLTGCASGIGRHLTGALAGQGQQVLATDIDEPGLAEQARRCAWPKTHVWLRRLDVRDPEAWQAVIDEAAERMGAVDVLVNLAGYLQPGWSHEMGRQEVDRHIDVNTKGVIFGTQAAARHMLARQKGHIINMASLAALVPVPGLALYSASKFAVRAFSLAVAQELRPHGIYVTVICPDAVQTPMLDRQRAYTEAALTFSAPHFLTVEEVADVIIRQVLPHKPRQVVIPRHRGWVARAADWLPGAAAALDPLFRRWGQRRQRPLRPP